MPAVLALDVNETLSDMSPLAARLEEVGASGELLKTWFASTLRDGIALAAAGGYADFATVAHAALRTILASMPSLPCTADEAATRVLSGMAELPLQRDVRPALARLSACGLRLVALTNGSADTTRTLLERGRVADYVELILSVDQVRRWKPAPEPYLLSARACGVEPREVMLAAVHPWDVDGAKRAGLTGAWINRDDNAYPEPFLAPDLTCRDFGALADALGG